MGVKTLLTARDLEQMPNDDTVRTELDEGELIAMAPAAADHGFLESRLNARITIFVEEHELGQVYSGDTGFILSDDTIRAPDLAFVRRDRVASVHGAGFARGAPDLAVEIFSPSDSVAQLMRKVKQYFAAGCHTVWILYPERKEIHVLEASGEDRILTTKDTLEAPALLPGFSIEIARLFS